MSRFAIYDEIAPLVSDAISRRDNATKIDYDIESLESLFTIVFQHDRAINLVFFGEAKYNHITDEQLTNTVRQYITEHGMDENLDVNLLRVTVGDDNLAFILNSHVLTPFLLGKELRMDWDYDIEQPEYCGWNSSAYDLPLMALTKLAVERIGDDITPQHIRDLSDIMIEYDGPPFKLGEHIGEVNSIGITHGDYADTMKQATSTGQHIDWAKIAKLTDEGSENKFPPGLKKEMARFGLDIVEDDLVTGENGREITTQDVLDLVYYNVNDVVGTRRVGGNKAIRALLQTRDILQKQYPYTAPELANVTHYEKSVQWGKIRVNDRDATAANLTGNVLVGPYRTRPVDNETVAYEFPLPSGTQDLLEFIVQTEDYVPQRIYDFFDHFRGKDTRDRFDKRDIFRSQPVSGKSTMNCPYYRDGKPTDSYITVSTGGAHGSVMAGLSQKSEKEVDEWVKSNVGALKSEKPTIDLDDVIHLDWSSFYPVMSSKLELYRTEDGIDRYSDIIEQRIAIKKSLPAGKHLYTDEDKANADLQNALKFALNNATGAGNTHKKYALLPLDNKTLSMRLIGNMLIWCLAQRFTQAGAYVIATNTDGIFLTNVSMEQAEQIARDYVEDYGMDVEPELIDRFINRDTSQRVEILDGEIQGIGGMLGHGRSLKYTDAAVGRNVPYPLAVGNAVVRYMVDDRDWLIKPYDKKRMRSILTDIVDESESPEPWYHIHVGSGSTRLTVDGQRQSKINRVVLTTEGTGKKLATERRAPLKKDECFIAWNLIDKGANLRELSDELGVVFTEDMEGVDLSQVRFGNKVDDPSGRGKMDVPVSPQPMGSFEDENGDFADYWKTNGVSSLIRPVGGSDGHWEPLTVWREGSLTNYTSNRGLTLPTSKDLDEFDLDLLDLDAYVAWAENILATWKVTADIPAIGMTSRDDTVVVTATKKRSNKKTRAADTVRWLYGLSDQVA